MSTVRTRTREYANGLRVIVSEEHRQPLVAVNLRFRVGSRHEEIGRTGFAHLFEHLMFTGTARVPRREHLGRVQSLGGNANATTSTDWTTYYHVVPTEALPLVLSLEADRLATLGDALAQQSLDSERQVVARERLAGVDGRPYGDAVERIARAVFPAGHPYHHLPIGSAADLGAATLEDARRFFTAFYTPDRAVLAVVGDVDAERVFAQVRATLGEVPPPITPTVTPEPPAVRLGETTYLRHFSDQDARLFIGIVLPPVTDPDYELHRLIAIAIGSDTGGRIMRRLGHQRGLLAGIRVRPMRQMAGGSLCVIELIPSEHGGLAEVEDAYLEEMSALADDGLTDYEFECAFGQYLATTLRHRDMIGGWADELSLLLLAGAEPADAPGPADVTASRVRAALRWWSGRVGRVSLRYLPTGA